MRCSKQKILCNCLTKDKECTEPNCKYATNRTIRDIFREAKNLRAKRKYQNG